MLFTQTEYYTAVRRHGLPVATVVPTQIYSTPWRATGSGRRGGGTRTNIAECQEPEKVHRNRICTYITINIILKSGFSNVLIQSPQSPKGKYVRASPSEISGWADPPKIQHRYTVKSTRVETVSAPCVRLSPVPRFSKQCLTRKDFMSERTRE